MKSIRAKIETVDWQTVALLETLTEEEWRSPSLCAHWTIAGVVGHLVSGSETSLRSFGRDLIRRKGQFHRASEDDTNRQIENRTREELLHLLKRQAGQPSGAGRLLPPRLLLGDHVIHLLDIAVALHREITIDPDAVGAVLRTQVALPNPFVPRLSKGLSLFATDLGWSRPHQHHDATNQIIGSGTDLLVALAGRDGSLPNLTGGGVAVLGQRIQDWKAKTDTKKSP